MPSFPPAASSSRSGEIYLVQSTVIGSTGLYRDEVSWPTYLIFVYPYGTGLLSLAFLLFAGVRLATRARAAPA